MRSPRMVSWQIYTECRLWAKHYPRPWGCNGDKGCSVPENPSHINQVWLPAGWNLTCSGDPGPRPAGGHPTWTQDACEWMKGSLVSTEGGLSPQATVAVSGAYFTASCHPQDCAGQSLTIFQSTSALPGNAHVRRSSIINHRLKFRLSAVRILNKNSYLKLYFVFSVESWYIQHLSTKSKKRSCYYQLFLWDLS